MAGRLKNGWVTMQMVCRVEEYKQIIKPQLEASGYTESSLLRSKFDLPISERGQAKPKSKKKAAKRAGGAGKDERSLTSAAQGAITVPPLVEPIEALMNAPTADIPGEILSEIVSQESIQIPHSSAHKETTADRADASAMSGSRKAEGTLFPAETVTTAMVEIIVPLTASGAPVAATDDDGEYTEEYDYSEEDFALPEATVVGSGDQIRDQK